MNKLSSLAKIRQATLNGSINQENVIELLRSFKSGGLGNRFETTTTRKEDLKTNTIQEIEGYRLTQTLSTKTAGMLKASLEVSGNTHPYPIDIKFTKIDHNKSKITISTVGDFKKHFMKNPRHIAALNVDKMANYAALRMAMTSLALSNTVQLSPKEDHTPSLPAGTEGAGKSVLGFLNQTKTSYMAYNKPLREAIESRLTKSDQASLAEAFIKGQGLLERRLSVKTPSTSPSTGASVAREREVRRMTAPERVRR